MARTLTNYLSIEVAEELSLGTLPGSPEWAMLEPNAVATLGATITTVARDPISKNRQRRKGSVVDLDSGFEFDADLTYEHFEYFAPYFFFASWQGGDASRPTAATNSTSTFTIPAIGTAYPASTLVHARGFTNAANNGLHVVDTGSTTTAVVVTSTLVDESPAATQNVSLDEAGFRFATGDAEIDADGNLITTTKDLTELPLVADQYIYIGGSATVNQFANAANSGFARVIVIAAHKLTLDKKGQTFVTDNGSGKAVDIFFGRYITNVAVDDAKFFEKSLQFEAAYKDLIAVGTDGYEYSKGNYANTLDLEMPLSDKAGMTFGFIGTDTVPPSSTRAANAASPIEPVSITPYNTSADIARLRVQKVDETGLTTYVKNLTIKINNNAGSEKVLATLGATFINVGNFDIDIETSVILTDGAVLEAIRNNTTVTMDAAIKNDDGALVFNIPGMTLGDGSKDFAANESIKLNLTAQAHADTTFDNSLSVSIFPYVP